MPIVSGKIHFETGEKPPVSATVYVRLLDTTYIDTTADVVSEQILRDVDWTQISGNGIEFSLTVFHPDPRRRYEISVLVDADGDGELSFGDFYTTQSYPVLTQGSPQRIDVQVQRIR